MHGIKDPEKFLQEEYYRLVDHLSQLPHKILKHHSSGLLSQMVLYELGSDRGFGLKRAAYLVDNPDFDHLVGVAGFCCDECKDCNYDVWASPDNFARDMQDAHFNGEVKKIVLQSLKRQDLDLGDPSNLKELGPLTGIGAPQFFSWDMKHGNHGLLVFESNEELSPRNHELLSNSAAFLSLCSSF